MNFTSKAAENYRDNFSITYNDMNIKNVVPPLDNNKVDIEVKYTPSGLQYPFSRIPPVQKQFNSVENFSTTSYNAFSKDHTSTSIFTSSQTPMNQSLTNISNSLEKSSTSSYDKNESEDEDEEAGKIKIHKRTFCNNFYDEVKRFMTALNHFFANFNKVFLFTVKTIVVSTDMKSGNEVFGSIIYVRTVPNKS